MSKSAGQLRGLSEDAAIAWLVAQFKASLGEHRGTLQDAIKHGHCDLAMSAKIRKHDLLGFSIGRVEVVSDGKKEAA